jgi:hypothetical protein
MSYVYETVVLKGDEPAVRQAFDRLRSPLSLRLFRLADHGFAVYCWQDAARGFAAEEVNRLAAELSSTFGTALAVHYDDGCGIKVARLFRDGASVREFGEADEVWTPMDDQGDPRPDGPRYAGDAVPPDVECDCIRQAIDAGLEAAGFSGWTAAASLRRTLCGRQGWLTQRLAGGRRA